MTDDQLRSDGTDDQLRSYGVLLLRLALGTMFIAHSVIYMLMTLTLASTAEFFVSIGLPAWLAYATMAAELAGGIALLLGIQTRLVALLLIPLILGTIASVHGHNGFFFNNPKGGWEYPAVWAILLVVQALVGDGMAALVPTGLLRRT